MLPGGSRSLNPLKEASAITQPLHALQPKSSFSLSWLYCAPLSLPGQSRRGWEGVRLGLLPHRQGTHQCLASGYENAETNGDAGADCTHTWDGVPGSVISSLCGFGKSLSLTNFLTYNMGQ